MNAPKAPSLLQLAIELPRSGLEFSSSLLQLPRLIRQAPRGDEHPVLVLPGYGGGDSTTLLLRYFLEKIGYSVFPLDLGVNYEAAEDRIMRIEDAVAFREKMVALTAERIETLHEQTRQPISLVGWSMGGLYALDCSQQIPDKTRQVITLGTPFGDPRGTSAFNVLRKLNRSAVPLDEQNFDLWSAKMNLKTDQVPIKVIHSENDGIVGSAIAKLADQPCVQHFEIRSSHLGFTVNPDALKHIAHLLAQP